jgi:hypothetical protein
MYSVVLVNVREAPGLGARPDAHATKLFAGGVQIPTV